MALNVLIVGDSAMMRNIVARVLALSGVEIASRMDADNGAEALQLMEHRVVDLVLADINMPIMNGEELIRKMSEAEKLRSLPVIVISSDGTNARRGRLRELGAVGYLQKPFRPEELRSEIERMRSLPEFPPERVREVGISSTGRILETMCFSCVMGSEDAVLDPAATPVGVAVRFSGTLRGVLELWVSNELGTALALSCLAGTSEADISLESTLKELGNMICGAALTDLCPDGHFEVLPPQRIAAAPQNPRTGQYIELDDGRIWISLEVWPGKWTRET
jgi:two-component system chemotaxis response regulator CheY